MVDNGCTVVDVIVEHPLYGQLTGSLQLSTRAEVEQFMARSLTTQPLSALTGRIHLHTLLCPDGGRVPARPGGSAAGGYSAGGLNRANHG